MEKVLKHIEKLREKPESHRRRVQVLVSGGLALVILILWGVAFSINANPEVAKTENEGSTAPSPLDSIKDDLTATVEQVRDGYVILRGDN
ncbi:MAG TPA: hypothetical protein VJJ24_00140 [Candidatus Paceibacterota bacterium]